MSEDFRVSEKNHRNIDRNSYKPAYIQLADIIKHKIGSGDLRAGKKLPSESQLCQRYNISPMTVRRAINILVDEGIVDSVQGSGTFVKPISLGSATFHLQDLENIFSSERTNVSILEARILSADKKAAQMLSKPEGERIIYIKRLLSREEVPLIIHREYLIYDPRRSIVESELDLTSLRDLFKGKIGGDFKWGKLTIEAVVVNEKEAELLQVSTGSAAFNLEHLFFDFGDNPVSWGKFICPATALNFTAYLGINTTGEDDTNG